MATGAAYLNDGQAYVIDLIDPATRSAAGVATYYVGWGSDGTTPANTQSGLLSAHPESRSAVTTTQVTTSSTGDTIQWVGAVTASAARTVQEAVIFTAASGGTALVRVVTGSRSLAEGDAITYTIRKRQKDSAEA